jgi:hypothetical protein
MRRLREPFFPRPHARAQLQQRRGAKVAARHRGPALRAGRAHRDAELVHQRPRIGTGPHRIVVLHAHVEGHVHHVEAGRKHLQVQAAARMQRMNCGSSGVSQPSASTGTAPTIRRRPSTRCAMASSVWFCSRSRVAGNLAVVAPPGLGELGAARRALHQPHADLRLENSQLLAHGAVREAQLLRGLAHAVVARDRVEDQQRAGARDVAAHGDHGRLTRVD